MTITLTLTTDTQEKFMDITVPVKATQMYVKSYRVDLLGSSTIKYRSLGISIGNIIGSTFIVDNNVGTNFFRLPLQTNTPIVVGSGDAQNVTMVSGCSIPLYMSGPLDKQFYLRVFYLDSNNVFQPIGSDLTFLEIVIEAII
jgi:hypothetical protein